MRNPRTTKTAMAVAITGMIYAIGIFARHAQREYDRNEACNAANDQRNAPEVRQACQSYAEQMRTYMDRDSTFFNLFASSPEKPYERGFRLK